MIGIAEFNSAIGGVKNHTEITGHNCGFGILIILTPDLAFHSAGGFDLQQANNIGCSHMTIPSAGRFLCSPKRGGSNYRQATTTVGNPAPEQNQAGGGGEKYRYSYLSIESQICNSAGNKKGSTANATSLNCIFLKYQLNQSIHHSVNRCWRKVQLSDCLALRFSDLSFFSQASITHNEKLEFSRFTLESISSSNSCGKRICFLVDLLFISPVAIDTYSLSIVSVNTPYTRIRANKSIDVGSHFIIRWVHTMIMLWLRNDKTPQCSSTNGVSNHNVKRGNTMAMYKSTQTHPKFKWRFFSCQQSRYFTVEARSEQEARSMLPDAPCLFSARIRQGVNHA